MSTAIRPSSPWEVRNRKRVSRRVSIIRPICRSTRSRLGSVASISSCVLGWLMSTTARCGAEALINNWRTASTTLEDGFCRSPQSQSGALSDEIASSCARAWSSRCGWRSRRIASAAPFGAGATSAAQPSCMITMASRLKAQTQVRKGLIIRIRFKTSLLQSSLHTNGAFLAAVHSQPR